MYEIGQSKQEARKIIEEESFELNKEYKNPNSPDVQLFDLSPDIKPLQTYENMMLWCGQLINNARLIDGELDERFENVIIIPDGIFIKKNKLKVILASLFDIRVTVRNLEIDIEEFIHVCSLTTHIIDTSLSSMVFQLLTQVNDTYKRVYDLTIYKLKSISNSRVTAANVLISIIALLISIFAFYINY